MRDCEYDEPMRPILAAMPARPLAVIVLGLAAASCCPAPPAALPPPVFPPLIPPLHDAQVGEWLRLAAGVDAEVYRVVRATDYAVDVEITRYHDEAPEGPPSVETWPRNGFSLPADKSVIRAIEPDRIEVAGKWFDCWRVHVFSHVAGLTERVYWICDKIPVHGLLKIANVVKGGPDEAHAVRLADWSSRGK